jgi:hypothetical protein
MPTDLASQSAPGKKSAARAACIGIETQRIRTDCVPGKRLRTN